MPFWLRLAYLAEYLKGLGGLALIVLTGFIIYVYRAVRRGEVRLVRTHYRLPNYSFADEFAIYWGEERQAREVALQRAARKVAVGR